MQTPTIAIALIVKNESSNLAECLKDLDWADEIVILDSGSTDNTKEISEQFGAKFFVNDSWLGFGKQRQIAQSYATCDWIFWIDADERITPELQQQILSTIKENRQNTVYSVPRLSWAFGRFIRHCGWYPDRVLRLYPTHLTHYDDSLVHEKVVINEGIKVKKLSGDLLHYTYKDLEHYLVKSAGYAAAWADQRISQGRSSSIFQGITHAIACFVKMYILKAGFLDGKQGFLLSLLSSHSTFVKYADLWIKTKTHKNNI